MCLWYCIILYYIVLCCVVNFYVLLCRVLLCRVVLYFIVLYYIVLCCIPMRDMKYTALESVSSRLISNSGLYPDVQRVLTLVGSFISYSVNI